MQQDILGWIFGNAGSDSPVGAHKQGPNIAAVAGNNPDLQVAVQRLADLAGRPQQKIMP